MRRCVIFGGGELKDIRFTQSLLREDDYIVCADRGYAYCAAMGRKPDLILGDFDSYNGKLPPGCEVLRYPIEKDDTDTMLAVKEAIRREFADILMLGMLGGRLDHTLANIQTIVYAVQHGASASIVEKDCRITALRGGQSTAIPYARGFHFSVFCHSDSAEGVSIRHAKYELENDQITNGFPIGVSNSFLPGEDAVVSVESGILVIVANMGK